VFVAAPDALVPEDAAPDVAVPEFVLLVAVAAPFGVEAATSSALISGSPPARQLPAARKLAPIINRPARFNISLLLNSDLFFRDF
jgi:hypothetical protein